MADIRIIRRRIRSVRNIADITRAMQMIAASKMKRAQERGLAGRPYSEKIHQVIADLAAIAQPGDWLHPLLQRRPVNHVAIVHITPDRGLCGGLIASINRLVISKALEQKAPASFICVGRKGFDFLRRHGVDIQAEFSKLGDRPVLWDTTPISRLIMDDFTNKTCDVVYIAYTRFVSTMVQRPVMEQILPVEPSTLPKGQSLDYIFEPYPDMVLSALLPRFVEMQVYHAILESIASEQSARMVAMRAATDNAQELVQELSLMYNKARQETITRELLDITGGAAAVS